MNIVLTCVLLSKKEPIPQLTANLSKCYLAVAENATIDLPDVMIDNEVEQMYNQQVQQ